MPPPPRPIAATEATGDLADDPVDEFQPLQDEQDEAISDVVLAALKMANGVWLMGDTSTYDDNILSVINILASSKFKNLNEIAHPLPLNCSHDDTLNPKWISLSLSVGAPSSRHVQFAYINRGFKGGANTTVRVYNTEERREVAHYTTRKFGLNQPLFYDLYQGSNGLDDDFNSILFCKFARPNNTYETIINNIFENLLRHSTTNGLYLRSNFDAFHLNMYRPFVTDTNGSENTESCFLGFLNRIVLNKQTQKLIESLACFSPNAIEKSSSNVAFIKMLLDCLVRIIVVREFMKALFTFGAYNKAQLYTSVEGEGTFFEIFLKEEIIAAVQTHFTSTGAMLGSGWGTGVRGKARRGSGGIGTWEKFQTEIMDEWIVGIMQILYQDETLTATTALELIIRKQIAFVQKLLYKNIPAAVLAEQESGFAQAFQVAASQVSDDIYIADIDPGDINYGPGGMAEWLAAAKNVIDLSNLDGKAKLWTIQNSALKFHLNPKPVGLYSSKPLLTFNRPWYHIWFMDTPLWGNIAASKSPSAIAGYVQSLTRAWKWTKMYWKLIEFAYGRNLGEAGKNAHVSPGWNHKKARGVFITPQRTHQALAQIPASTTIVVAEALETLPGFETSGAGYPDIPIITRSKAGSMSNLANGNFSPFGTLSGIDSGLVRDSYVELKYNPDFYHNLTLEQRKLLKETFFGFY